MSCNEEEACTIRCPRSQQLQRCNSGSTNQHLAACSILLGFRAGLELGIRSVCVYMLDHVLASSVNSTGPPQAHVVLCSCLPLSSGMANFFRNSKHGEQSHAVPVLDLDAVHAGLMLCVY